MKNRNIVGLAVITAIIAGCTSTAEFRHPEITDSNAEQMQYYKDSEECELVGDSAAATVYNRVGYSVVATKNRRSAIRAYESCMKSRGWVDVSTEKDKKLYEQFKANRAK